MRIDELQKDFIVEYNGMPAMVKAITVNDQVQIEIMLPEGNTEPLITVPGNISPLYLNEDILLRNGFGWADDELMYKEFGDFDIKVYIDKQYDAVQRLTVRDFVNQEEIDIYCNTVHKMQDAMRLMEHYDESNYIIVPPVSQEVIEVQRVIDDIDYVDKSVIIQYLEELRDIKKKQ